MIAIIYAIISNIHDLKLGFKNTKYNPVADLIELIVASILFIGYTVWIVFYCILNHMCNPIDIVSFLIAQEAIISGVFGSILAVVNEATRKIDNSVSSEDEPESVDDKQ